MKIFVKKKIKVECDMIKIFQGDTNLMRERYIGVNSFEVSVVAVYRDSSGGGGGTIVEAHNSFILG